MQCRDPIGLLLDESAGLLYVSCDDRVISITVQSSRQRRTTRLYPLARLWSLGQRHRAELVPLPPQASEGEVRAHGALRRLMRCPVEGVIARVISCAF